MKKRLLSLLLAAVLLLAPALPAAFADTALTSEEEVLALFEQQKQAAAEEFEFTCSKALFQQLMDNDARLLGILQVKAGISRASVRYSDTKYRIRLTHVEYSDAPWTECANETEARQAAEQFLSDGTKEFTLICPKTTAVNLAKNRNLNNAAARAGYGSVSFDYYKTGVIRGYDPQPFEGPYAVVDDDAQFASAVEGFARQGTEEFTIVFLLSFYTRTVSSDDGLDILCFRNAMDRYRTRTLCPGVICFSGVTYTDEPCLVCSSEEDLVEAIVQMGASGHTAFRLYLAEPSLHDSLMADSKRRLHELEAKAGMSSCSLRSSSTTLFYSDAKIVADPQAVNSVQDAREYVGKKAGEGAEEITLFCSEPLYDKLVGNLEGFSLNRTGMEPIYDLIAHAGIFDYELSASRATRSVTITVHAYYPGTEILQAVDGFRILSLPERLRETLLAALEMAAACKADTDLETARNIHDALAERVVYTIDDDSDEDDTAVGALLNGRANCDGYADAFYLVGTLAGLHVRYQHGDSLISGPGVFTLGNRETHMWNLVELDGTWRMVDVTWDDNEEHGTEHTWFNLGYDRASRTHVWNAEMTVALQQETDMTVRPENEYAVTGKDEMLSAVYAGTKTNAPFSLIFDNPNYTDYHAALTEISRRLSDSYRYSWDPNMRQLRVYPKDAS